MPFSVVKAARNGAVTGWTIASRMECVACKRPMWTCDPTREDLCEEDDYLQRRRNWDLRAERAKRNNMKPIDPFGATSDKPTKTFWPLDEL